MITLKISGVTGFGPRDEKVGTRGAGAPRRVKDGVIIVTGFLHTTKSIHTGDQQ